MIIHIKVEIVWLISGFPDYGFGKDKHCYNLKRNRRIKQTLNNSTVGYVLNSKFVSLKKLKQLLYKPDKNNLPF